MTNSQGSAARHAASMLAMETSAAPPVPAAAPDAADRFERKAEDCGRSYYIE